MTYLNIDYTNNFLLQYSSSYNFEWFISYKYMRVDHKDLRFDPKGDALRPCTSQW